MAFLGGEINRDDLPEGGGGNFDPIPAGWYTVKVTEGDVKATNAGDGEYIKLRLDVLGPSHEGRILWCNLNIKNPNAKAEEIGRGQLRDIMNALALHSASDTDQFIGGVMSVKVTVKDDPKYGPGNDVKSFKAVDGSAPPQTTQPSSSTTQQPASSGAKPPWAK